MQLAKASLVLCFFISFKNARIEAYSLSYDNVKAYLRKHLCPTCDLEMVDIGRSYLQLRIESIMMGDPLEAF